MSLSEESLIEYGVIEAQRDPGFHAFVHKTFSRLLAKGLVRGDMTLDQFLRSKSGGAPVCLHLLDSYNAGSHEEEWKRANKGREKMRIW
jgi:hypothetical protein